MVLRIITRRFDRTSQNLRQPVNIQVGTRQVPQGDLFRHLSTHRFVLQLRNTNLRLSTLRAVNFSRPTYLNSSLLFIRHLTPAIKFMQQVSILHMLRGRVNTRQSFVTGHPTRRIRRQRIRHIHLRIRGHRFGYQVHVTRHFTHIQAKHRFDTDGTQHFIHHRNNLSSHTRIIRIRQIRTSRLHLRLLLSHRYQNVTMTLTRTSMTIITLSFSGQARNGEFIGTTNIGR